MSKPDYDVFIIGAGLAGASLALSLSGHGMRIGVAEAHAPRGKRGSSDDDKALALSYASVRILETLGLGAVLQAEATRIRQVHVSQQGSFGVTRIRAQELDLDSLGQVIPARVLGNALIDRIRAADGVELHCPASVQAVDPDESVSRLTLQSGTAQQVFTTGLIAGADGARSALRKMLGIEASGHDYDQVALAANVNSGEPHDGRAFERFTPQGPLALLPLTGQRMGLVWTNPPDGGGRLMELDDTAFLQELQLAFGNRLGRFTRLGARVVYPLCSSQAHETVAPGAVLIGNAAQALHPVAAQGFNLGLRDVAVLAEELLDARRRCKPLGAMQVLDSYARRRASDRQRTQHLTHGIAQGFLGDFMPISQLRGLGLFVLDALPPIKRAFARRAMGLSGPSPMLARGLPL